MLLKENDVAKANNTVRSEEISSEIWFIALSYPSLSSLLGRAARRGVASPSPPFIHTFIDIAFRNQPFVLLCL